MNDRKSLLWNIALILIGIAGTLFFAIQFAMAIDFQEYGRVMVYFILTSCSVETAVFATIRLFKKVRKSKEKSA